MRLTFAYAATIAAILMVSQASFAGALLPEILVVPAPLLPYVDAITHGTGNTTSLMRPGQDPHSFALAPSQAQALDAADIIIVPDLAMNPVLARMIAGKKKLRIIELSGLSGADPLPYATANQWLDAIRPSDGAPEQNQDAPAHAGETSAAVHKDIDPHFWLDPERMAAMAAPLADSIAISTPEARERLIANANALATHLRRDVMPPLAELLRKKAHTSNAMNQLEIPFITYHASYQYFFGRFGLNNYGQITTRPEETIGGKSMDNLLGGAYKLRVRCLIGEQKTVLMKRIARLSGAKIILLSPEQLPQRTQGNALDWIKNDYDLLLYKTARIFSDCL